MATFQDQLDNKRIKTLSQDLLNQPQTTGQLWDTLGLTKADIEAPNFWNSQMHPLQTNDEVKVRVHDAVNDAVILYPDAKVVASYVYTNPNGYDYVSQLVFVEGTSTYQSIDLVGLEQSIGQFSATVDTTGYFTFTGSAVAYAYLDADSTPADITIEVLQSDGTTVVATAVIPAATAVRGTSVELDMSALAAGSTSYILRATTTATSTKPVAVHFFAEVTKGA